jgi:type IV secretion system protein VirB4
MLSEWSDAMGVLNPVSTIMRTVGWAAGAAATSMLAFTVIPSAVRRVLPIAAQDEFWTFLPFLRIAEDRKTIICKQQRHMRVIELEGAELTLAGDAQHEALYDARKHWVDELERFGLDHVKIFSLKQRIGLERTMRAAQPVVRAMDEAWERNFPRPTKLSHYVVLVAKGKTLEDTRVALDSSEAHTMSSLADYGPKVLIEPESINEEDFDDRDRRPHGPLKPFAHVLSPISQHSPMGSGYPGPLPTLLTADSVDFSQVGKGIVKFASDNRRRWAAVMTWRDCGDRTSEAIMRELTALDHELIIYHSIRALDTTKTLMSLKRQRKGAKVNQLSANAEVAYDEVLKQVEGHTAGERSALVHYAMHVIPICNSETELEGAQKEITRIMSRTTGTTVSLRRMAQPTYMAMADPAQAWPRHFRFLGGNVAANLYLQKTVKGNVRSDWCNEPLAWLRTLSGDPYPFQLHVSAEKEAVAHTVVIGATGAGKTTLMTFIAAQAMRVPRLRVYLFDRLFGMKVFTTCAGGNYVNFDGATSQSIFNPLHMPDTPANRTFLLQWLQEITKLSDTQSRTEFARLVDLIYVRARLPKEMRSLKALASTAFSPTGDARYALTPWIEDNQYGRIFNADEETMNLDGTRLSAFNMTQILNDDVLAPAVVSYLVHRIQNISQETKDPSLVVVDETSSLMRNELFANRFLDTGLREGRKLRQAYALCFQTPGAMMATGKNAQVILDQCQTKIFFRMGRDSDDAIQQYGPFGLNKAELDFLARKTFKRFPYAVLIKQNDMSAIVDADLRPMGKLIRVLKSGTESVGQLEALIAAMPRELAVKAYIEATT